MASPLSPPLDIRRDTADSDITLVDSGECIPSEEHAPGKDSSIPRCQSPSPSSVEEKHELEKQETDGDDEKAGLDLKTLASGTISIAEPDHPASMPDGKPSESQDHPAINSSIPWIELTDDNVYPAAPQTFVTRRYDCRPRLSSRGATDVLVVAAWSTSFQHDETLSRHWSAVEHPEGQRYFRKQLISGAQLFTDLWLYDSEKLEIVEAVADYLFCTFDKLKHSKEEIDVVIGIEGDGPKRMYYYYCANRTTRTVFWPEPVYATTISQGVRPVSHPRYLKDASAAQYWNHVELYPNDRYVSLDLVAEVRQLVHFAAFDSQTSLTSTSPYGPDDLAIVAKILRDIRVGVADASSMFIIARVSYIFYWERFLNFHGQQEARLDRERTVYEENKRKRSYLIMVVSPLLFYLPDEYMRQIRRIWVDQTINHRPWKTFVTGLQRDWESSILPATVLLSANVGLLAIGSIDTGQRARTVAQIASYISTFFSLGNIVLCTILARFHRTRVHDTADDAANYLHRRSQVTAGLELLAIAFSLPAAMFCWGMVAFFIAMAWVCFDGTSASTRVLTALFLGIITILTAVVLFLECVAEISKATSSLGALDLEVVSPLGPLCGC
ncbi:hypothetical protein WOLCODRAFT_155894 [Wolfiporia cocos MD-104 SS10]|uniref:WW domain-containing protein n=1 Tax=Wolfiporia cocos (strain MD-104) TaxID=742152 RepID=A0A2H3IYZ9_WOLCO|nr:hypothetical protein WOLCODRAFT_155894 [Wolfiporia cocos MD-104 SS10]